ncbi:MAG: type II/IV secretion system protein [Candidatus Niyogibacteria bacterium]|nr:type II/IV secretion system protein [Candidatus Niyogibacteria bacterium]
MISDTSLARAWAKYAEIQKFEAVTGGLVSIAPEHLAKYITEITNIDLYREILTPLVATRELRKVSDILEVMLAGAYSLEASDIHLEPQEDEARLRLRLDGVLQDVVNFPMRVYELMISRLKLISAIKINVKDRPQDGRFTIHVNNADVEVRVSALPGAYGESLVMRVLHPKSINISFEELGMPEDLKKFMEHEIQRPNGMILTTGPTGSGKTTTLYAFIKKVLSPEIKIITIENPVEYHIKGISQSQVRPDEGYGFADALRSILRQDPDVILVGEIRDLETASTAMNAALTGHLVFSTLHTNNAFGTIPRFLDLGVSPSAIAPALNVAMAQRLLRVLCKECKKEVEATAEDKETLSRLLEGLPEKYKKPDFAGTIKIFAPVGCDVCNNTGYKGRVGVYEAFRIDDEVEKIIMTNPIESEFRAAAARQGMMSMEQDGALKVVDGKTSIAEVVRVLGD